MTLEEFKFYILRKHNDVINGVKNKDWSFYEQISRKDIDTVIHMGELGFEIEKEYPGEPKVFFEEQWQKIYHFWLNYKEQD